MSKKREAPLLKGNWRLVIKATVSLLILALIFLRFDPAELWNVMRAARVPALMMAVAAASLITAGKIVKWFLLVRQVTAALPLKAIAISLLAGMGFGLVTPSRVGEIVRVTYLPVSDKSRFVGLVAVDRFLDLGAVILASSVAIALALNMRAAALTLALPVLVGLALLFTPQLPARLVRRLANHRRFPWRKQANQVADGLALVGGRVLALTFFLSVFILALAILQFSWLLGALQAPDSLLAAAVSFPVLTLAGILPFTLAGFGAREGASVVVLALYDIPEAVAVNAALLSFALNTLFPALLGLILSPAALGHRRTPETAGIENGS